jgi:hypothetical protein
MQNKQEINNFHSSTPTFPLVLDAAGSTSFTGIGAIVEKAAKHAFVDAWMGGVKNAVYGGELSPLRDAIGGALSSVGNGFIDSNMNTTALKVASSAVLGGTISEIGGGKFANGAVTGAYSMLFNELMHPKKDDDPDDVQLTKRIRDKVGGSKIVQKIENSTMNDDGAINVVLKVFNEFEGKVGKWAGGILKAIDITNFMTDYVAPITNSQLEREYNNMKSIQVTKDTYGRTYVQKNGRIIEIYGPKK